MVQENSGAVGASKDRDQRLQSARKKLKSYRAKQAQMEKAKRQSMLGSAVSNASTSSLPLSPTRLVGSIINEASQESQMAMMSGNNNRLSASFEKRHSRTMSRSGAGHGRGHSRTGSISLSQNVLAASVVANALGHVAQRSSISASRPLSTHFANTTHSHTRGHSRSGSKSLVASRSRPTSLIGGLSSLKQDQDQKLWRDEGPLLSSEDLFKTPTINDYRFGRLDAESTPQQQASLQAPAPAPITNVTQSAAPINHNRRPSRHSRQGSVSTRRESMEIMGGLPFQSSNRQSRRISSNRWSGLQSASVLFGGIPDLMPLDKRDAEAETSSDDEGGDRLTALEKLEGRRRIETQHSSVQLPTFDDVHGDEAMDKRASLTLLESNSQTTSSERLPVAVTVPVARPQVTTDTGNDLGILVEEEEEEEDASILSPVKERDNLDFTVEEEKRKRQETEQEIIKRNRRGSLTPKPLKLKSRPASLFVAPRTTGMSTSPSLPELSRQDEEEEEESNSEEVLVGSAGTFTPVLRTTVSANSSPAQQKIQSAHPFSQALPQHMTTPSKETKRSWHSSMPVVANRSPTQVMTASPSPVTASSRSGMGMRALRLGSNVSTTSTTPSLNRQHKTHTDSTSSLASIASTSSAALSKRGSLLYNASPMSSTTSREELSPSVKRRGSLLYKTSPLDNLSTNTPGSELSISATPPVSALTPSSIGSTGGVPLSMFEELKSKHQRELGLLDDARSKIARLESEVSAEAERKVQELAELEQWSAEEKRSLGQRIEHLEATIVEVVQVREAKEQSVLEEKRRIEEDLAKIQSEFEDVEAERDMLRDDVDGWRARCSDLEKVLRSERRLNEELKHFKQASKQRIKELLNKLQEHDVVVERSSIDEDELSTELMAVLRSPAVGPVSPMLGSQRDGSTSPIHGDVNQMPPPQAVQLLKEMRQQIFNLAGSLDHERKQHILARQEAEAAKSDLAKMTMRLQDESPDNTTVMTMDSRLSTPEKIHQRDAAPSMSTPPPQLNNMEDTPSKSSKKKRNHVFAYDSSMDSRRESNSMGSVSVSTNQTSQDEEEIRMHAKNDEAFVARVQADLAGLGLGTLGTLPEEEEVALEEDQPTVQKREEEDSRQLVDIESGRRTSDVESVAPPTPALDHAYRYSESVPPPVSTLAKEHTSLRSSASSSMESHGPPSPLVESITTSSTNTNVTPHDYNCNDLYDDSYIEDTATTKDPRPEFIREWSFERATAAIRAKKNSTRTRPTVVTSSLRKNRPMSIEDFFGIMSLDENQKLPPLPTPEEALEMPPLFIEESYSVGPSLGYGGQPRYPSQIRAPVPRSSPMYDRSIFDRSSSSSRNSASFGRQVSQGHYYNSGSKAAEAGELSASAMAGSMFSRVASLTSAFSGLGGYLIGTTASPSPTEVAARPRNENMDEFDMRNNSTSWAMTRREEEMA